MAGKAETKKAAVKEISTLKIRLGSSETSQCYKYLSPSLIT